MQHSVELLLSGAQGRGVQLVLLTPLHTCTFPNRRHQPGGAGHLCKGIRSVPPHALGTCPTMCRCSFQWPQHQGVLQTVLCSCAGVPCKAEPSDDGPAPVPPAGAASPARVKTERLEEALATTQSMPLSELAAVPASSAHPAGGRPALLSVPAPVPAAVPNSSAQLSGSKRKRGSPEVDWGAGGGARPQEEETSASDALNASSLPASQAGEPGAAPLSAPLAQLLAVVGPEASVVQAQGLLVRAGGDVGRALNLWLDASRGPQASTSADRPSQQQQGQQRQGSEPLQASSSGARGSQGRPGHQQQPASRQKGKPLDRVAKPGPGRKRNVAAAPAKGSDKSLSKEGKAAAEGPKQCSITTFFASRCSTGRVAGTIGSAVAAGAVATAGAASHGPSTAESTAVPVAGAAAAQGAADATGATASAASHKSSSADPAPMQVEQEDGVVHPEITSAYEVEAQQTQQAQQQLTDEVAAKPSQLPPEASAPAAPDDMRLPRDACALPSRPELEEQGQQPVLHPMFQPRQRKRPAANSLKTGAAAVAGQPAGRQSTPEGKSQSPAAATPSSSQKAGVAAAQPAGSQPVAELAAAGSSPAPRVGRATLGARLAPLPVRDVPHDAVLLPVQQYKPVLHACWEQEGTTPYLHIARALQVSLIAGSQMCALGCCCSWLCVGQSCVLDSKHPTEQRQTKT